jgi:DNA-binding CsgD family transcriptional regulator
MAEMPRGSARAAEADLNGRSRVEQADAPWLLEAVLDRSPRGVVMLGSDGLAVHLNAKARQIVAGGRIARLDGNRLRLTVAAQAVGEAIEAALAGSVKGSAWLLVPTGAGQQFVFTISPLDKPAPRAGRYALVLIQELQSSSAAQQHWLRKLFGLTAAEAAVATGIAEGRTPREIAAARGVADSTVRMQLKAIMRKLGCRRQAEVAAKVCGVHPLHED